MDPKKQELNPDLKQIYERVMSTDVKRNETPGAASAPAPEGPQPAPAVPPPAQAPAPQEPSMTVAPQTPQAAGPVPYLPSTPPRTQTAKTSEPAVKPGTAAKKSDGNYLFSGKLIAILVVVGLVLWGVVWAKVLNLF